ncbi:MAG: class I SAM-dependent methyltransferase [Elusimicrobiales bacterium]|nr:class I SAM-dependent methyltransferase [Elusimicrobiales bacterium]
MKLKRILNQKLFQNVAMREKWVKEKINEITQGSVILDVGAGGQPYREDCAHLVYKSQDFSMLKDRDLAEGGYGRLDYVSDICHIPEKDACFDAILCTEVLEHVPEPVLALREMGRLLKSGGVLILTAPLGSFLHQAPYHYFGGYTRYFYERFLKEAGFVDIKIDQNGGFFRYFAQECQRAHIILFHHGGFKSLRRWALFPVEVVSGIVLVLLMPIICSLLDRLIETPDITIGYHVRAVKC